MKIGILGGTGRMGRGLARGYANAGHEVFLGSRSAQRAIDTASGLGDGVSGGSLADAAQIGELVVLAVPFGDAVATVEPLRDSLAGKIVIDITNPFGAVPPGQVAGIENNCRAADSARWVAAYKTTFWKTLEEPSQDGQVRDVFVNGQDEEAKRIVMQLITETGFRPIDCGGFENARTLDLMVPLMLELDSRYHADSGSSWKFLG
jgi:NADPH-dependent F420 reductase